MAQGPPPVCLDSLEPLLHDTSNNCLGLETNFKFFDISRFQWRGRPQIAVNTGNNIQIWDISDPQSPHDVDNSGFGVPNQGDSDYDLLNYSICDDCRWGVATYKLGHVLFGMGIDPSEPDFQQHRYYETGSQEPLGSFTFEAWGEQYLLTNFLPGDCGGDATLYSLDGTAGGDFSSIGCVDVPGYDGKIMNGFHIEKDGTHWLYLGFGNRQIYVYQVLQQGASISLQYVSHDPTMKAFLARGKGMGVDRVRELAVTALANNGMRIWDISSPGNPTQLSFISGDVNLAAITYPFVWTGRSLSPDTSKTYSIEDPANPEVLDTNFWHPDHYWNSHTEDCEWPQGAVFSPDGMTMYFARYSVVQMVDFTLCAGPLQPIAQVGLPGEEPFPGTNATVTDNSLPTVERRAIWVTNNPDPAGPVVCGDDPPVLRADYPQPDIECWIRKDLGADMERWAHVAVDNSDFPCGGGSDPMDCPGTQIATRKIEIDRTPEALIDILPPNPITGDTVDLRGAYEGIEGSTDPFEWKIWLDTVPVGTYTTADVDGVTLAGSGDYLFQFRVDYDHEDPADGEPYQTKTWKTVSVTSVAADLSLPVNPLNTVPIVLDGSGSSHSPGITPSYVWTVTGPSNYGGCPDADICTIPADTLSPGDYVVTLTLINNGDQSTAQGNMEVLDGHFELQLSPASPEIGEAVQFSITGFTGDVEAAWDFGGPGCDPFTQEDTCFPLYTNCLSTVFKYSTAGPKTVSVVIRDPLPPNEIIGSGSIDLNVQDSGSCDGCTFALNPVDATFSAEGGATSFAVETQTSCVWTPARSDSWITITDPGDGSGADVVSYFVAPNTGSPRSGWVQVRDLQHLVTQTGVGDADLASSIAGPGQPEAGQIAQLSVTYGNDGPDDTLDTLINVEIPFGLPAGWTGLTAEILDDLQNSAAVLDALGYPVSTTDDPLGNWPLLLLDDVRCDRLRFQVQGPNWPNEPDPTPVAGLVAGVSSTWTFDLPIPTEGAKTGQMEIVTGAAAGARFSPATTADTYIDAHAAGRFGTGLNCRDLADGCSRLVDCFGARLWQVDPPVLADLAVVDDGCSALQGFPSGKIALGLRSTCSFGEMADFAQSAGASAVIIVNDGRCGSWPDSDNCVIDMDGGSQAGTIDVPVVMLSKVDGQPLIDEINGGATVRVRLGNIQTEEFAIDSMAFHSLDESDPDPADDGETFVIQGLPFGPVFGDDFDLGDWLSWSSANP